LLFFEKSQPAPVCLAHEQTKASGDYKCGDVLTRLQADFKNKCYICEAQPTAINVEHFRPHKGDRHLMFDWNNLYWACVHCNNTKLAEYTNILDCTNPNDRIEERIRYFCESFPKEIITVEVLDDNPRTIATGELILAVLNGVTPLKRLESANLRSQILEEVSNFLEKIDNYRRSVDESQEKAYLLRKIKAHLQADSPFTSFKRWIIRDNDRLKQEFGEYI
jgi:uncharacterized protein (TIGR02646 family)